MEEWKSRTVQLIGAEVSESLNKKNVLVVGIGGVGAYAAEMIVRAGVGKMTIIDGDTVSESNINRQLIAQHNTIGRSKSELMKERLLAINPTLELTALHEFLCDDRTLEVLENGSFDYVVDAIDTFGPKLLLVLHAYNLKIPIVSSMGAGGKSDPSQIMIADISKTYNCALAKVMRKHLKKQQVIKGIKTVFSAELAKKEAVIESNEERNKKSILGTISYLPAIFGCNLASVVLKDFISELEPENKN